MLFSSPEFIFGFLPVTFIIYFWLARLPAGRHGLPAGRHGSTDQTWARLWLLFASIFFYGWWDPKNIILIAASMGFNFTVANWISRSKSKAVLTFGVAANLAVLFYYKYSNFFFNEVLGSSFHIEKIVLPLGISFFTFTQIAYLVDCYRGDFRNYKFQNYCLFVTFFPHLIAGPIVHHTQLMPQFDDRNNTRINFDNIARGLFVFNMGLAKKIVIADTISAIAVNGYSHTDVLTTSQAWITSVAYSMQLYFDFSGYSDMAIGLGLLFNIDFPINFNSPYKSKNIQEFWRRWHITLSKFLRDYIYIPLGGNRSGELITARNLMITFILGGIWHGAGWTFIAWGFLHGFALVFHRQFEKLSWKMPDWLGIVITFAFVNIAWVFFRAVSWHDAMNVLKAMIGMGNPVSEFTLISEYQFIPIWIVAAVLLFTKNTNELTVLFRPDRKYMWRMVLLVVINLIFLNSILNQEFLYFDF
jgi:alginate O-acetyltransferase complex protein AlgI